MDHSGRTKWVSLAPNGPKKIAKIVLVCTIFSRFSITSAQFSAHMISEIANCMRKNIKIRAVLFFKV